VPARWRRRMASLTITCNETDPAPYPRERLPSLVSGVDAKAASFQGRSGFLHPEGCVENVRTPRPNHTAVSWLGVSRRKRASASHSSSGLCKSTEMKWA
jgi:hypothetical protein